MKLKVLISCLIILIFAGSIYAQPHTGKHEKREQIRIKKLEYIKKKLQLTSSESKSFSPLYSELCEKKSKLHDQKKDLMRKYKQNNLNLSDKEISEYSDKYIEFDYKLAVLAKDYHYRFKKILSPVKLLLLYRAEKEFHRHLINEWRGHGRGRSH